MVSRRRYLKVGEKRKIMREQIRDSLNNSEIASRYSVSPSQIRRWRSKLSIYQTLPSSRKNIGGGRLPAFLDVEEQLYTWIVINRGEKRAVTVRGVVEKLKILNPDATQKSFFNLQRWTYRFLNRKNLTVRKITRCVSVSDLTLVERFTALNEKINEIYTQNLNILWINMDQTSVEYDMPLRHTVEFVGMNSVQIRTGSGAGGRVTVSLTICSDGTKLPVFVVFKGRISGRIVREFTDVNLEYPRNMVYSVQESAWTDETVMLCWISNVLRPFIDNLNERSVCIVLDSYSVHKTESVLAALRNLGIYILFIPGGLTSQMQPLDIGINGPFKHWIREAWSNSMADIQLTPQEKRVKIANTINQAWERITPESVSRSFNNLLATTIENDGEIDEILIESDILQ